jgi:outer membrane protein assembly factor BamD
VRLARSLGFAIVLAGVALPAYAQFPHLGKKKAPAPTNESEAPDKVLYDRAMDEIKHSKFEVARLQLQALLNTYPDSVYLAKAKLAVADSYYKEGGSGNLDLAVDEYKSFITFFPFVDEAAYAQMQVAMTHYRRMYKPDRDRSEAVAAEQEFQVFLEKYPDSPLRAQSEQHLREVQEVLAEGDFRVASFYMTRKSYKAASGRLADIAARYPLYSKSDQVLWMLGTIWEKAPVETKQEEALAAARKAYAGQIYTKLLQDYPLSKLAPQAKERLTKLGLPIPKPDPTALARMQKEQEMPRKRTSVLNPWDDAMGMIHGGPDVSSAARVGEPQMEQPDDNATEMETLHAAAMTRMNVVAGTASGASTDTGSSAPVPTSNSQVAFETISADGSVVATPTTTTNAPPTAAKAQEENPLSATNTAVVSTPTETSSPAGTPAAGSSTADNSQTNCSSSKTDKKNNSKDKNQKQQTCKEDKKDESSSKKKTGLKKIIPF